MSGLSGWKGGLVVGTVVAILGSGALAMAQSGPEGQQRQRGGREGGGKAMRTIVHSDSIAVDREGTVHNMVMDRGRVTSVDASSFKLERRDKVVVTVTVGDQTKIRRNGEDAKLSDLQAGDNVAAVGEKTGGTVTWRLVRAGVKQQKAERPAA